MPTIKELLEKLDERLILGEISEKIYEELKTKLLAAEEERGREEECRLEEIKKQKKIEEQCGEMVFVEGGTFNMGTDDEHFQYANPVHIEEVDNFYIGKFPVTFEQYDQYCDENNIRKPKDEAFGRGNRPVINVSQQDAVRYCEWVSEQTGKNYRLPTEAEWEYAAKGGKKSRGFKYSGSNNLNEIGWYRDNSLGKTHPVGEKKGNELGLYDMSGNVFEWCSGEKSPYPDPRGLNFNSVCSCYDANRGGSWRNFDKKCQVVDRGLNVTGPHLDEIGFRLVRDV